MSDRREAIETAAAAIVDALASIAIIRRLSTIERQQSVGLALRDLFPERADLLRVVEFASRQNQ